MFPEFKSLTQFKREEIYRFPTRNLDVFIFNSEVGQWNHKNKGNLRPVGLTY